MSTTTASKEQEETGVKQSDAVKEATTLVEHGFPVNTALPDGSIGQVMATKNAVVVDADGKPVEPVAPNAVRETVVVIEGENGPLEISGDPHILQAEGTAAKEAEAAASASQEDAAPKQRQSKSEN